MAINFGNTTRYALRYVLGTTTLRDIDSANASSMQDVDDALFAEFFPGLVVVTARATAPSTRWLMCDGAAVSRTGTTANLFTAIGTAFGTGNGTSTFNVPDLRGRVVIMTDGTAARLSANDLLGNSGGTETKTLATANLPAHSHVLRSAAVSGGVVTEAGNVIPNTDGHVRKGGANATGGETEDAGSGTAFNIMPPNLILNYLIHV